jgi:hypothetical protein
MSRNPVTVRMGVAVTTAVGTALAVGMRLLARARRTRPLHPRGTVHPAALRWTDEGAPGATALGAPGRYRARVRVSRAGGLPPPWPDVAGLAVRWNVDGRPQDLLLSSTGAGRLTRYVLRPTRHRLATVVSTLMPLRAIDGPIVIAAFLDHDPRDDGVAAFTIASATPLGPWTRLGSLSVDMSDGEAHDDPDLRFDPTLHCPAGLGTYRWEDRLRSTAYRAARDETARFPAAGSASDPAQR